MMRAIVINETGGPEVLKLVADRPAPSRGAKQVLIRTVSIGVNPVDVAVRSGAMKPEKLPKVLGGDVAGYVEEAPEGSRLKKGDKVFALTWGYLNSQADGCYAEFVVADEDWVVPVPDSLPLEQAAGVPLVSLTAWQALQHAKPKAGQKVLITAASGGVGHMAVQLAKALGLHVTGIAGPRNLGYVKSLGADDVVDYTSQDVAELYSSPDKQFDIAIDCMGSRSDMLRKLLSVTKPSGHYSHILNAGTDHTALEEAKAAHEAGKGPSVSSLLVHPSAADLQQVADLIAAGKVKLHVALSLPWEQVAQAHEQVATGHTRGKVVLTVS